MTHRMKVIAMIGIVAICAAPAQDPEKKSPKYVGTAACKMCHNKKEKGEQHAQWLTTAHAKAFEKLAGEEAKKIAAEKKIADPQKDGACVQCHTAAYGVDAKLIDKKFVAAEGVQCEACHGPGELHIKNRVKEAAQKKTYARGALKDETVIPCEDTCKTCHNEKSPTYKEFKFEERLKLISHKDPTRDK